MRAHLRAGETVLRMKSENVPSGEEKIENLYEGTY